MSNKAKALGVRLDRATGGMAGDILGMIEDAYFTQGLSLQASIESVHDQLVQMAIDRYSDKIRAALGRAGLDVDGELTLESIKAAVIEKTGLELTELSPDAMAAAVDQLAARRLSDELGVEVATLAGGGLADAVRSGVRQSLADGKVPRILGARLSGQVRVAMTWKRGGFDPLERKRIMGKIYQKRYRRNNVEVWD